MASHCQAAVPCPPIAIIPRNDSVPVMQFIAVHPEFTLRSLHMGNGISVCNDRSSGMDTNQS